MKTYEGERTLRGIKVTVDGLPLPPRMAGLTLRYRF